MVAKACLCGAVVVLALAVAGAQESRSEIGLQVNGFFTTSTSSTIGGASNYRATKAGGLLGTYRYHLNRFWSVEAAYGFDRNSQIYTVPGDLFRVQSNVHQGTAAFVLNLRSITHSKLSPYFLMGGGVLRFQPTSSPFNLLSGASGQTRGAFVYGAGLSYAVRKRILLRAEYRGLIYATPDFGFGALSTQTVTHTAEPSIGLSFRF